MCYILRKWLRRGAIRVCGEPQIIIGRIALYPREGGEEEWFPGRDRYLTVRSMAFAI